TYPPRPSERGEGPGVRGLTAGVGTRPDQPAARVLRPRAPLTPTLSPRRRGARGRDRAAHPPERVGSSAPRGGGSGGGASAQPTGVFDRASLSQTWSGAMRT